MKNKTNCVVVGTYTRLFWVCGSRYDKGKWVNEYPDATMGSKMSLVMLARSKGVKQFQVIENYGMENEKVVHEEK